MRKKVEREPDLVEFKINYTLDEDLPVEKYFMAYNSTDALKAFAQSCVKFLEEKNLSDIELSSFLETFANPEEFCIEKTNDLSAISIKLPTENVIIPGIYYFIFQRLSWEGVNINEVISTSNEFTILMDEDSVNVAFEVIKNLKLL